MLRLRPFRAPDAKTIITWASEPEEYILWKKYSSFTGDEGELCDKDGSFLLDKNGNFIQKWIVDNEGYLSDLNGNPIYYSDGGRVRERNRDDYLPYIDAKVKYYGESYY